MAQNLQRYHFCTNIAMQWKKINICKGSAASTCIQICQTHFTMTHFVRKKNIHARKKASREEPLAQAILDKLIHVEWERWILKPSWQRYIVCTFSFKAASTRVTGRVQIYMLCLSTLTIDSIRSWNMNYRNNNTLCRLNWWQSTHSDIALSWKYNRDACQPASWTLYC